ncbi:GtrA family protein [Butyrivibrio sp. FC2001]|uniref:GtrA family protein n=1 Tax=Butyrivibrio sp. FC2001 TaxID=1280671 RepID=UPI003FA48D4C
MIILLVLFISGIICCYGRIISATMSYNFNHRFVFKKKHRKKDTLYRFLIVSTSQMLISAFIVANLHRMIGGKEVLSKISTDFLLFFMFYYF